MEYINLPRFAILMFRVRVGDRPLPLIWSLEAGTANLGFEAQRALLQTVAGWLPAQAVVLLAAERFYPSASPGIERSADGIAIEDTN